MIDWMDSFIMESHIRHLFLSVLFYMEKWSEDMKSHIGHPFLSVLFYSKFGRHLNIRVTL